MRRKILLGVLLGLAALGVAAWRWIDAAAERSWASMETRAAGLLGELRTSGTRRPGPLPGDAWDDYLEALDLLSRDPKIEDVSGMDEPELEALLDRNPRVPELVRRGARRAEARHPDARLPDGAPPPEDRVLPLHRMSTLVAQAARRLAREGKPRESRELLLDLLRAGADATRGAVVHQAWTSEPFYEKAVDALLPLIGGLSPGDRRDLDAALEGLEADLFTTADTLRAHLLCVVGRFQTDNVLIHILGEPRPPGAWDARGFGFSTRLMFARAFEDMEALLPKELDVAPYAELDAIEERTWTAVKAARNPVLEAVFPDPRAHAFQARGHRARLRVLRTLMGTPGLDDPFGGKIRSAPGKAWSRGYDGADDGGEPLKDLLLVLPAP